MAVLAVTAISFVEGGSATLTRTYIGMLTTVLRPANRVPYVKPPSIERGSEDRPQQRTRPLTQGHAAANKTITSGMDAYYSYDHHPHPYTGWGLPSGVPPPTGAYGDIFSPMG